MLGILLMKNSSSLSDNQLRELYRDAYVQKYHQSDSGRLQHILQHIPISHKDEVADYACGNGLLVDALKTLPKSYWGIDFSSEFIQEAKRRFSSHPVKPKFICQDIISFTSRHQNQFDWAFTLDFSEHIYDDQFIQIYQAIGHSLKKSGHLVLHTPNADFILERLKSHNWLLRQFPEHIAVRYVGQYQKLLTAAGFTDISVLYLPHYHPLLSWLGIFHSCPILGHFVRARLLITAQAK